MYNAHKFWSHPVIAIADVSRVRDDVGKFYFAHNFLHVPVFGVHGSFFFTSGRVENQVTWDTDSLVEDFWFGIHVCDPASSRGSHTLKPMQMLTMIGMGPRIPRRMDT